MADQIAPMTLRQAALSAAASGSGEADRLLLVLRAIAQHYLDHRCPHRQEAQRG